MGAEVLDDADVRDPGGERPLPARDDLVELAELARRDPPAGLLQRRVVALDVPDGADEARGAEGGGEPPGRRRSPGRAASRSSCARRPPPGRGRPPRGARRGRRRRSSPARARAATGRRPRPAGHRRRRARHRTGRPRRPARRPRGSPRTRAWWRPIIPRPGVRRAAAAPRSPPGPGEVVDGRGDVLEVALAQAGVHRQGEDLVGGPRGLRAGRPSRTNAGRRCVGTAVERARCHAVLVEQGAREAVPVLGHADRVLVEDVDRAVGHGRRDHALDPRRQVRRVALPLAGPRCRPCAAAPGRWPRGCRSSGRCSRRSRSRSAPPCPGCAGGAAAARHRGRRRRPSRPRRRSCSWWGRARTSRTRRTRPPGCRATRRRAPGRRPRTRAGRGARATSPSAVMSAGWP